MESQSCPPRIKTERELQEEKFITSLTKDQQNDWYRMYLVKKFYQQANIHHKGTIQLSQIFKANFKNLEKLKPGFCSRLNQMKDQEISMAQFAAFMVS